MAINRTTQSLEERLVNDVSDMQKELKQLKNAQPVGADVLEVQSLPGPGSVFLGGPVNLPPNNAVTFTSTLTPTSSVLTLWNFKFSVYVDILQRNNRFPLGSNLTIGQINTSVTAWSDYSDSSEATNTRFEIIRILNEDTVAHNYWVVCKAYLPKLSNSGIA